MRYLKYVALLGIVLFSAGSARAQVFVGGGVGPVYAYQGDVCDYGYYGYAPYACAPYGYYEPEYFVGGVFIRPWLGGFGRFGGFRERGFGRRGFDRRGFGFRGDRGFRGGFRGNRGFAGGGFR